MVIDREFYKALGKAILLSSMQFSIASVAMSSTFSVMNFSTDQRTLQRAACSLAHYALIGALWTAGNAALMYANYGRRGLVMSVVANLAIFAWISHSYCVAFRTAAREHGLAFPDLFRLS